MSNFELHTDKKGKFRFNLRGAHGQILAESEAYESKASAENGIESVKKNSTDDSHYQIKPETSGAGGFYASLKAGNGQVIAHSRRHKSQQAAQKAVAAIKDTAASATMNDRTV